MQSCTKCATSHHGATRVRYPRGVCYRTQLAHRRVLVRADADKELKDVPGELKEEGRGLPAFLKPLTDFGVGRTSVWEGGVGLFIIVGAGMVNINAMW